MSSIVTAQPSALASRQNQSRTCRSRSVSVRRQMPPFGVPPIFAVSMRSPHSRSGSICRLLAAGAGTLVPHSAVNELSWPGSGDFRNMAEPKPGGTGDASAGVTLAEPESLAVRQPSLTERLKPEERERVRRYGQERVFQRGETIFAQGQPHD